MWNDQNTTNNSYIHKQRLMLPAMATTQAVKPHNETVRQRKKLSTLLRVWNDQNTTNTTNNSYIDKNKD